MPFPNEHAARQANPDDFVRFRRGKPDGFPAGLGAIFGIGSDGRSKIQSVRADAKRWTEARFREWLTDHDFKATIEVATGDNEKIAKANSEGVMVALMLPLKAAEQLAMKGGEAANTLHVTLAYLGKASEMPDDFRPRALRALSEAAKQCEPIEGRINGLGRVGGSETSGSMDVVWATFDAPALSAFRESVVAELKREGLAPREDHGFTPRITLADVESGSVMPEELPALELRFADAQLVIGDTERERIELGTGRHIKQFGTDPEAGVHAHVLDRENARAREGGAHLHLFVLPNGSQVVTAEDGAHGHALPRADAEATVNDGEHAHEITLPDGTTAQTGAGASAHQHSLMVFTTGFDGQHKHTLTLADGTVVESLMAGEFWREQGMPVSPEGFSLPSSSEIAKPRIESRRHPCAPDDDACIAIYGKVDPRIVAERLAALVPMRDSYLHPYLDGPIVKGQRIIGPNALAILSPPDPSVTPADVAEFAKGIVAGDWLIDIPDSSGAREALAKIARPFRMAGRSHRLLAASFPVTSIHARFISKEAAHEGATFLEHAQHWVESRGLLGDDSDYGGMLGEAVIRMAETFSGEGHSGMSARFARAYFNFVCDAWDGMNTFILTDESAEKARAALAKQLATGIDALVSKERLGTEKTQCLALLAELPTALPVVKSTFQGYVLGVALEPNPMVNGTPGDHDDDTYTADAVRATAHKWMAQAQRIGLMHREDLGTGFVLTDSIVLPEESDGLRVGKGFAKPGSWLLGGYAKRPDVLEQIRTGALRAWSIEGSARRVPVGPT